MPSQCANAASWMPPSLKSRSKCRHSVQARAQLLSPKIVHGPSYLWQMRVVVYHVLPFPVFQ